MTRLWLLPFKNGGYWNRSDQCFSKNIGTEAVSEHFALAGLGSSGGTPPRRGGGGPTGPPSENVENLTPLECNFSTKIPKFSDSLSIFWLGNWIISQLFMWGWWKKNSSRRGTGAPLQLAPYLKDIPKRRSSELQPKNTTTGNYVKFYFIGHSFEMESVANLWFTWNDSFFPELYNEVSAYKLMGIFS